MENVCTEIYSWFKQSPARKEDLIDTINDFDDLVEKTLLYFTITRWVLLGKVIARILSEFIHRIFALDVSPTISSLIIFSVMGTIM